MMKRYWSIVAVVALAAAVAGMYIARQLSRPALPALASGTAFPDPMPLSPFALVDVNGDAVTPESMRGHPTLVFFGFTHCPDVCPTTLADMAQVMRALGADADRVQVLFVSVDPERDTQAALAKYVPAFDARFLGLRGDLEATRRVAKEFKVYFEKRPGKTAGEYSIDHSAQSYVIDPEGRLRLFVRHERIAEDLAPDLRVLLR